MVFKRMFLTSVLLCVAFVTQILAGEKYNLDTAHSSVNFKVKHMVISTTNGNFSDFTGTIMFDEQDLTKSVVDVTIKSSSISTNNEDRDKHLRGQDFFDAEKFPEVTFKSTAIEKRDNQYVMIGDFTMHGVTKKIEIPFTLNGKIKDPWGNERIGADGQLTINRMDYGVSWSKTMDAGGLVVGNDVVIELHVEAIKAK